MFERPSLSEAMEVIRDGIIRRKTILIAGAFSVDYVGRASSRLEKGERLCLLKPDGSALVHRPRDYPPINWQPPGSIFQVKMKKEFLVVRVFRRKEKEVMEINFTNIIFLASLHLKDLGEFSLYATEKDMQKAILLQPTLLEDGFRPITEENHVNPGFIDILGVDKEGIYTVIEIKRVRATKSAVIQLKKYMDTIQVDKKRKVRGILVAPGLMKGVQELLATFGYEYKILSPQVCAEVIKSKSEKQIIDFFK